MESFHLLLQAHWDLEPFPIFNLQLPIPNWAAIENWKLKIEDWQALAIVRGLSSRNSMFIPQDCIGLAQGQTARSGPSETAESSGLRKAANRPLRT
jgi:hypothetical protein